MTTRTPWIMGNWKLNPSTRAQAATLSSNLKQQLSNLSTSKVKVAVFPSIIHLSEVHTCLHSSGVAVGAQAISYTTATTGAYTGEVSATLAASAGATMVLVGHSERRHLITETASQRLAQANHALTQQLTIVLCVGEQLAEREAGKAQAVVKQQLDELLCVQSPLAPPLTKHNLVIAYEPVWAIGTGKTASAEDAQAMHLFIRGTLANYASHFAEVSIVYGGSVNAANALQFAACTDIDGVLVGGASLNADTFCAIIDAFAS